MCTAHSTHTRTERQTDRETDKRTHHFNGCHDGLLDEVAVRGSAARVLSGKLALT